MIKPRWMVDTNVLLYALKRPADDATLEPLLLARVRAARRLIQIAPSIRISSIVAVEALAFARPEEHAQLTAIYPRLDVAPFDLSCVAIATRILRAEAESGRCTQCGLAPGPAACETCGRVRSKSVTRNDAYILAVAEALGDVDVVYSFDGMDGTRAGLRVRVLHPESADGELFDPLMFEKTASGT